MTKKKMYFPPECEAFRTMVDEGILATSGNETLGYKSTIEKMEIDNELDW